MGFLQSDLNGEAGADLKTFRLVIRGTTFENRKDGEVVGHGPWKFVEQKGAIFHINISAAEGPEQGKVFTAIFEWTGDDGARRCGPAQVGGPRPTKFNGAQGSKQLLVAYKRAQQ